MDFLDRWATYYSMGIGSGLIIALQVLAASLLCTILWGLAVALLRMSPVRLFRIAATAYIEFFRGTPILVQILLLFAALPIVVGVYLEPFETAVLALTLNAGSSMAESYRSGLQAVPRGQYEAAAAMGMNRLLIFRRVILPQAIRVILPAIGNILVALLLTTPFIFLVGLEDMMAKANQIVNRTGEFSVYVFVSAIYIALGLLITLVNDWIERRLRLPAR